MIINRYVLKVGDPSYIWEVFIREKKNKSGSISIQILEKRGRRNYLIQTIGSSKDEFELATLRRKARHFLAERSGQLPLPLSIQEEEDWFFEVFNSIKKIRLIGPELILGKLFDEIGFNAIPQMLFRHLVITRLVYPSSKLKTIRYLREYNGQEYEINQIYRYLDKLQSSQKKQIEQISYDHTLKVLRGDMSVVFYDVTTIYFEADKEDDLRKAGFSKEGKHKHPQILLGLLVGLEGYPLAYEIFEGNKYEGHTMLPLINRFKKRFKLKRLVIIADSGLMTNKNVEESVEKGYEFILGARIKNETKGIKERILNLKLTDGQSSLIEKKDGLKLVISYTKRRAAKDAYNRERGLKKLEKALAKGKLTKNHINNRGYNKYLCMKGEVTISIDYEKFEKDAQWDGLKGYLTNTTLSNELLIKNYNELWKIEKAFRISKTDLRIRPIYRRLQKRIEAHICISFTAYKVYKELERLLVEKQTNISTDRAIEVLKTIYGLIIEHPQTFKTKTMVYAKTQLQRKLLKAFDIQLG